MRLPGEVGMEPKPILLSQAHVTDLEAQALVRAVTSGWVTPLGPEVDAFEAGICAFTGAHHALALSSGTAAIHLGLLGLGVFLDVEERSWGLDPVLLESVLADRASTGRRISAIVPVDLFGRPADHDAILAVADRFGVPVLVDAAESLGARHGQRAAGTMGHAGVFSFNGNKIMTTSGGGMLVSADGDLVEKARFWSTQSRQPLPWYEHEEIGFNYRMSNLLAALGRAQLARLPDMIERRRRHRALYTRALEGVAGLTVTPDPPWGTGNAWLTTVTFDRGRRPGAATQVREALAGQGIEARPIWKPMHQQPVFREAESHLTGVADQLFEEGLCLPSGAGLTDDDVGRVAGAVRAALR